MVFEGFLATFRSHIVSGEFDLALADITDLQSRVEARYATLNPQQKAQWEDTRQEIGHIIDHLRHGIVNRMAAGLPLKEAQRQKVLAITDGITVI